MKKIILTGGGTGGHVIPALILIEPLIKQSYEVHYIGSHSGIERKLVTEVGLKYYPISTGKLRRYIDKKNIADMLRVVKGIKEALSIIKKIRPTVVFSKGGFVSVPVVIAAWLCKVPVIIHESDITMGLANKIAIKFAKCICTTWEETKGKNIILTGTPIRKEITKGTKEKGKQLAKITNNMPTLLIMGGSSGSVAINNAIRNILPIILQTFNVIHICGKGNLSNENFNDKKYATYKQYEFVTEELPHFFALCDLVISRSGANALQEFLYLKKPSLLIPLPKSVSRGDQVQNAHSFKRDGYSIVLNEESLTNELLLKNINELYKNKNEYEERLKTYKTKDAVSEIIKVINKIAK